MSELVHIVAAPASAASGVSPQAREALGRLADVAVPPPVPWTPQTAGWAVLAAVLVLGLLWLVVHLVHRWRVNRYRREALAELARLESALTGGALLAAVPPLLKRCALAAWPRDRTASLHQADWTAFVAAHARGGLDPALGRLLDDLEYQPSAVLAAVPADEAHAMVRAARRWIGHHRVVRGDRRVPA